MTSTSRAALRMSAAAAVAATALATTAHAEYRCATPGWLTLPEVKACELARQTTPDALVHYVKRTKGTYNLYVYDYVDDRTGTRWSQGKDQRVPNSTAVVQAKRDIKKASKFE